MSRGILSFLLPSECCGQLPGRVDAGVSERGGVYVGRQRGGGVNFTAPFAVLSVSNYGIGLSIWFFWFRRQFWWRREEILRIEEIDWLMSKGIKITLNGGAVPYLIFWTLRRAAVLDKLSASGYEICPFRTQ